MTYGWAILIIAVVLGVLFQLGVFNAANFAPKATAGACQVMRPNGPGRTGFVNLVCVCNGELPEFVAVLTPNTELSLNVPSPFDVPNLQSATLTFWYKQLTTTGCWPGIVGFGSFATGYCSYDCFRIYTCTSSGRIYLGGAAINGTGNSPAYPPFPMINLNQWYFVTMVFNGALTSNNLQAYINGQLLGGTDLSGTIPFALSEGFQIGYSGEGINSQIANIQFYNTSLSQPEVQTLYTEGIGGAPINVNNLVSWWPLNGNGNDYSGNNYGLPAGLTYTSAWTSGYTPP